MSNDIQLFTVWTFITECSVPDDVSEMLIPGETAVCAYKTIRDIAIFTNKRLIVRDAQGITGKKIEIYTLPYSSIIMYSTENAGKILDLNAEVEMWTKAGKIKINLQKDIDIRALDKVLATYILN
ncbi:MAG: PH domain-containing protein [Clostridia bacterium]|nr:PH domain-containing protein [Clostridia bacterium]